MPSTPTTKSQVQAYRFVLRRMQSALVRKDAVMLHDPMRTHSRATIVGVVLSALAMVGFIIVGFFKPAPKPPDSGIVIGEPSGSVYVVAENPKKLIPTFNLASARLMLMASQQGGEGGQAAAAGSGGQAAEPEVVPDDQLKDIPRGRLQGIPNGPELLPAEDQLISTDWAVCDQIDINRDLPSGVARDSAETTTTVFAGLKDLGRELTQNQALLVVAEDGKHHLIYRQGTDENQPNANAVRAEVDMEDASVRRALELDPAMARRISMGLLNAIPAVGELKAPTVPGAGETPDGFDVDGLPVGAVFAIERSNSTEYYVITRSGTQPITQAVADMIRFSNTQGGGESVERVSPDVLTNVPSVGRNDPAYLDVDYYPPSVPTVLDPLKFPVGCLGWSVKGTGPQQDAYTAVYVGSELPGPKDAQGKPQLIDIGSPSPDNWKIDSFYMRPGFAAAVRSATTKETFGRGNIQLISDRGMRYGIPNTDIATGLGLNRLDPAPESIIKLLPVGASLNTQDVMRTFDAVPVDPNAGSFQQDGAAGTTGGN
ncbi:type VII secretion protein EccB [Saccharomonospora amisosensis]|nr:type VII secretion protein EccB [Saccharomonospora amisosensis]